MALDLSNSSNLEQLALKGLKRTGHTIVPTRVTIHRSD